MMKNIRDSIFRISGPIALVTLLAPPVRCAHAEDHNRAEVETVVTRTHAASREARERALRQTISRDTAWPPGAGGEVLLSPPALSLAEETRAAQAPLPKQAAAYHRLHPPDDDPSKFVPEEATDKPWG